jgi:hypothetical protein
MRRAQKKRAVKAAVKKAAVASAAEKVASKKAAPVASPAVEMDESIRKARRISNGKDYSGICKATPCCIERTDRPATWLVCNILAAYPEKEGTSQAARGKSWISQPPKLK